MGKIISMYEICNFCTQGARSQAPCRSPVTAFNCAHFRQSPRATVLHGKAPVRLPDESWLIRNGYRWHSPAEVERALRFNRIDEIDPACSGDWLAIDSRDLRQIQNICLIDRPIITPAAHLSDWQSEIRSIKAQAESLMNLFSGDMRSIAAQQLAVVERLEQTSRRIEQLVVSPNHQRLSFVGLWSLAVENVVTSGAKVIVSTAWALFCDLAKKFGGLMLAKAVAPSLA